MAGDWIPCEVGLFRKSEVVAIGRRTKRSRHDVGGLMLEFWGWCSNESVDGRVRQIGLEMLPDIIGGDRKFWEAVVDVGWLVVDGEDLVIPNAARWITKGAKARLQKNRRQAGWRDARVDGRTSTDTPTRAPTESSTEPSPKASTREEKRRENINRRTQQHRVQPDQPAGGGAPDEWLDDPDPDGSRTLSHEQAEHIAELRGLTRETDREAVYATIVRRLGKQTFTLISALRQAVNDKAHPVENPGAVMVDLAKEIAERAGIQLFRRRAA